MELRSRFDAKVDRSSGPDACWPWTAALRRPSGYGRLQPGHYAHRLAWEIANGPIPAGMHVLHRCDNPPCCNPAHLWLGTQRDNIRDAARKGRTASGSRNAHAKLTEDQVRAIRATYAAGGVTQKELAARYGVSLLPVNYLIRRKTWKHIE